MKNDPPTSVSELERAFPTEHAVPPLLVDFANWLARHPDGSIGDIALGCFPAASFRAPELFRSFADFGSGPSLSMSLWLPRDSAHAVVLETSDGEREVIPSVEALIARIALGTYCDYASSADGETPDDGEEDRSFWTSAFTPRIVEFEADEEGWSEEDFKWAGPERAEERAALAPDLRGELGTWLLERTGAASLDELRDAGAPAPDFAAWLDAKERALADAETDAERRARTALDAAMESDNVLVLWAGDAYVAVRGAGEGAYMPPYEPAPEAEALRPHLTVLREARAERTPGLGLWHSAILTHPRFGERFLDAAQSMLDDRGLVRRLFDRITGRQPAAAELFKDARGELLGARTELRPDDLILYPRELAERETPAPDEFRKDEARFPRAPSRIEPWLRNMLGR